MFPMLFLSTALATTWTVDSSGDGDAATLAEGLTLLEDGDTLLLMPGVYEASWDGTLVDNATIEGSGWENTIFLRSSAGTGADGRGLVMYGQDLTLRGVSFRGYDDFGIDIALQVHGSMTVESCAFLDNNVGIGTDYDGDASLTIINSLFGGNNIGLEMPDYFDTVSVESSVFVNNERGISHGGWPEAYQFNTFSAVNNTFAGGTLGLTVGDGYGYADAGDFAVTIVNNVFATDYSWGANLTQYASATGDIHDNLVAPGTQEGAASDNLDASPDLVADPLFVAWSDDGDWTNDDLRLSAGSPAIDLGADGYTTWPTDMGGLDRALDGDADGLALPDLGAYEYCPPELCPVADTGAPTDTGAPPSGRAAKRFGCATAPPPTSLLALLLPAALLARRRRG